MNWPPNPSALVLGSIVAVLIAVSIASWSQRDRTRGARSFTFLALATALWVLAEGAQALADDPFTRLTWLQLRVLGVATLPVAFLIFANDDTRRFARLDRHAVALLLVIPAATVGLAWTFSLHELLWRAAEALGERLVLVPGPWWWVHAAFGYATAAAGTAILARARAAAPRASRAPTTSELGALAVVWVVHVVVAGSGARLPVDPTPFAVAVAVVLWARGLLTHRVRDVVPMARDMVLRRLPDPVLVLDPWRRVLQANAAAAEVFDVGRHDDLIGRDADDVFREQPTLRRAVEVGASVELEIEWSRDPVERHFRARTTPLPDRRGRRSGQLLYLQDVARERLVERERRATERDLVQQRGTTSVLLEGAQAIAAGRAADEVLEELLRRAAEVVGTPHAALFRCAPDDLVLDRWCALGRLAAGVDEPGPVGDDLAGRAWRDRRTIAVEDYPSWPDRGSGPMPSWARAALAVPLFDGRDAYGALLLVRPRTDRRTFSGDEQAAVVGIARLGAHAVARERWSEEIDRLRREVATLEARVVDLERPAAPPHRPAAPPWRFEEVDLADVVRRAARGAGAGADRRPEVDLVLDVPTGLPPVIGDRERLLRITLHLIARALANTSAGCVVLHLGRDHDPEIGDALVLRVRDTGEVGDAEVLAQAFEPPPAGASAVLHACRLAVERHGGRLWSNGSSRGGATVAIVVPLGGAGSASAEVRSAASSRPG
ncbi:MAG: histidine kinase N-terminal 7TM domain-containing protein [Trueperaceae bacterium]